MNSERKRILAVFSDVNFSPQLVALLQELKDRGATFRVILIGNTELQIAKQIKVQKWDMKIIRQRGKFGSLVNFIILALEIRKYRPETIFASGQFAMVIGMFSARLLNVPRRVFIRHHSSLHHKYKMKFGIIIDRISNCLATTIVAVSMVVKNILIRDEFVDEDKVVVIHNGVHLTNFLSELNSSKAAAIQNIENTHLFHIGVVSRLTKWKGVEYTATAFVRLQKEFPNSRLHIVGAFADSYTDVKNILSPVASERYTLEKISSNIPLFFHGLDAFVHVPVGLEDEAFGLVYIEALSSGIPCIFTKSGVLNELEALDSYADIVSFRDSEEIYVGLKKLIQGVNATKIPVPESWLNHFSLDVMAKSYADLLLGEGR